MPGRDGSGPVGNGPIGRRGRANGGCVGPDNDFTGYGPGYGAGYGMRFGRGGGFRARRRVFANNYNAPVQYEGEPAPAAPQEYEQQSLKEEIQDLKSQLNELKQALTQKTEK
ncbi:MAG: DUF5320 domain-containing protein [Candidatus Rifleibacteriota bacterium]